jgi:protease I
MDKVLLVIAPQVFRDEELFETREELEKAGFETVIASTAKGICKGKLGGEAEATVAIDEVRAADYQAIVFVGGMGSQVYFDHAKAHDLAWEMYADGKIVSAICAAPVILAKAGLLKDKKATVYPDHEYTIKQYGALYSGEAVVVDGNIITGNGPESSNAFGQAVAKHLREVVINGQI